MNSYKRDQLGMEKKYAFIVRLLTRYLLYAYLCLIASICLSFSIYLIYKYIDFPFSLLLIIPSVVLLPVIAQFLRIILSIKHKYRYYKISLYRLKTRGYKDEYFECEMHEACYRLMIRDILLAHGYKNEYRQLKNKCIGRNVRVERAKERLLEKVKRGHDKKRLVINA